MSAYVVSFGTMDRAIWAIYMARGEFAGMPLESSGERTTVGRLLYKTNVDAVCQRYPQDDPKGYDWTQEYEFGTQYPELPSAEASYKGLRCLSYQCCEGDVPDGAIYKELEAIEEALEQTIGSRSAEYENAPWDD